MADSKEIQNIVLLGGSVGAIGSAHYLLRHVVKHLPNYKVIIVSPNAQFLWRPACPRATVSKTFTNDSRLFVSISDILKQYPKDKVQIIQATATDVNTTERAVTIQVPSGDDQKVLFDALIVATGASTASPLLGLTGDENSLRQAWKTFQEALPNAKNIVIAGGGPAGIETAGELGEMLNGRKGWFGSSEPQVKITVVTAGSQILPHLRASIAETAERYLADVGVEVVKDTRVQSVSPEDAGTESNLTTQATIYLSSGSSLSADLYIPAMGTKPNTSFINGSLLAQDGRIKVDPVTLRVEGGGPRIYAVGDASTYARPTIHSMFDAIPVLCTNMKHDLLAASGKESELNQSDRKFTEDIREAQFVPIGSQRGVGALMGWRLPSWVVSWAKGKNYLLWATSGIVTGKQWAKE